MSSVSFMEKLLDGVEVEWKALGEIAIVQRGASPRPIAQFITDDDDGVPWIKIGDTESGSKYVQKTAQNITKEGAKKSRVLNKGDFIISNSMSFGRPYILNITGAIHDGWASISGFRDKLNSDFLYHYLASKSVQDYWLSKINSGSVSNLNADIIKTLLVPIPCPENPKKSLEIQAEIVRILDTFTELTAELTAELSMRKKQYNYYRDKLLTFEEGDVEWKTLGDIIATIKTGKLNANAMSEDGEYPFFTCDANPFKIDSYAFDTEAIIVSGNGSQVGHINYYKGKFNAYQRTYILADCSDEITMGFLLAYLKAYLRPYIFQHSKKGSVPYITMPMLQNFKIPILSIKKQTEITSVLDKFDTLTHSISEGLPREIELRQKQYEYYRDLLLSFPKPEEVAA